MPTGSYYLGPGQPRLRLSSWSDVETAAASGVLAETAWVELKEAVPASSKSANKELARDLASLSVDGGTLLIGVRDKTFEVTGVSEQLSGITTRVSQVASVTVNPPLSVTVAALASPDGDSYVLVVSVPASGSGPHMVDGKYYGRTAEGKRVLADTEVERIMFTRRATERDVLGELDGVECFLEPDANGEPENSHLVFLARPRARPSRNLIDAIGGTWPLQIVRDSRDFEPKWSPWGWNGGTSRPHPNGLVITSDDPRLNQIADEQFAFTLLLRDDGAVLATYKGASAHLGESQSPQQRLILPGYLLEGAHVLTRLTAHLGAEYLAYWSEYDVALKVTDTGGLYSSARFRNGATLDLHPFGSAALIGDI